MKDELKSLSLAIVLSFIAIYSVNYFFGINKKSTIQPQVAQAEQAVVESIKEIEAPTTPKNTDEALAEDKRIAVHNNSVNGSIRLKGSRFDNLSLSKYNVSLEENSPKVELLKPLHTQNQYFAELGWLSLDKNISLPSANSVWESAGGELTPQTPVTLIWQNNEGIKIIRKISIDPDYLFTIEDTVENNSGQEIEVFPYALISRNIQGLETTRSVVHEGVSGIIDGTLKEFKYSSLKKNDSKTFETKRRMAWLFRQILVFCIYFRQ